MESENITEGETRQQRRPKRFTPEQLAIITAPRGHALITAAAGGAKTTTAAYRIAYLLKRGLKYGDLGPKNIAAVTFSVRAADTLLDRAVCTVEAELKGAVRGIADLRVATFHSFCMTVLRDHVPRYRKFETLNEAKRYRLVRQHFDVLGIGRITRLIATSPKSSPETIETTEPAFLTRNTHDIGLVLEVFDRLREEGIADTSSLPSELRSAFFAYEKLLEDRAAWDYAGAVAALRRSIAPDATSPDCLALQGWINHTLRVLLVDEAQDNACDARAVLERLAELGTEVWEIGDVSQVIYAWRSADAERFVRFAEAFPGAEPYTLSVNFRQSDALVAVANGFLTRFMPRRGVALSSPRIACGSHHVHQAGDVAVLRFATQEDQYRAGARWIKARIGTPWLDKPDSEPRGMTQNDVAVLCRTRGQMADVVAALRSEGLNAQVRGAESLLIPAESEMLAVAADYLAGGRTEEMTVRDGRGRKRRRYRIIPVAEEDVRQAVVAADLGLTERDTQNGIEYLRQLRAAAEWSRSKCLVEVLEEFLMAMRWHVSFLGDGSPLAPDENGATATRNDELAWHAIRRVLSAAADFQRWQFTASLGKKIKGFAPWLRLEAPLVYKGDEEGGEDTGGPSATLAIDAVQVMTCHAAKGLEWPLVWIPDLADRKFPLPPRPSRIWDVLPPRCVSPAQRVRINGTFSQESSLAYVAITRAARYLLATYAPPSNARNPHPSPFFTFLEQHPVVSNDQTLLPATDSESRLPPTPRAETRTIRLTFSQLFNYWVCPRQFYLRHILGYPPPIAEPLGYGKSIHSACWEVHRRVMAGEKMEENQLDEVVARHFHLPYAGETLTNNLREAGVRALKAYVRGYRVEAGGIAYAEQEVRLDLGSISVIGRIDLACVLEGGEIVLDELKTERAARNDQELLGPCAYGVAMQDTMGTLPERVGTRPVTADGAAEYRSVMMDVVRAEATRARIRSTGDAIARREFPMLPTDGSGTCARCDVRRVCWRWHSKGNPPRDKEDGGTQ